MLHLARVGQGEQIAVASEQIALRAVLVYPTGATSSLGEAIPSRIQGAQVTWHLDEGEGEFDAERTTTGESGLAETTLIISQSFAGTIKVHAEVADAITEASWTIEVRSVTKRLRIIPNAPTVTLTDTVTAGTAAVTADVGSQVELRVRVTAPFGRQDAEAPISEERVTFSFVTSIAGSSLPELVQITSFDGIASVPLSVGTTVGTYKVTATIAGNTAATFNVSVTAAPRSCTTTANCNVGDRCVGGFCRGMEGDPICGTDTDCPIGYSCDPDARSCMPIAEPCDSLMCPVGYSCDPSGDCVPDSPQCGNALPCPSGAECHNGICYPVDVSVKNVTGHWYTHAALDLSGVLPSFLTVSAPALQGLNEILRGELPNAPAAVNALLSDLAQYYIPSWARALIGWLSDLTTNFARMDIFGEMDLVAVSGPTVLSGFERWDRFVFYLPIMCGNNIDTIDPAHPPACAAQQVFAADLEQAAISVSVTPFAATLSGDQLTLGSRQADFSIIAAIDFALRQTVQQTTGYESLQGSALHPETGALYGLIDCAGVADLVQSCGVPIDIEQSCKTWVNDRVSDLAEQFASAVAQDNAMTLSGQASVTVDPNSSTYATRLGPSELDQATSTNGLWEGHVTNPSGSIPVRWQASRTP